MILHTHEVATEVAGDTKDVWVLHVNAEEAKQFIKALKKALKDNPDADSFGITLGEANALDLPHSSAPASDLIVPEGGGLIVP